MKKFQVILATDGACKNNPGPGGYAGILKCNGHEKVVCGSEQEATNNRMELMPIVECLRKLTYACDVTVVTDSNYACTVIALADKWMQNNWKLANGRPPKNLDLVQEYVKIKYEHGHTIHYTHVKGHSGHPDNERCDTLAREQIEILLRGGNGV